MGLVPNKKLVQLHQSKEGVFESMFDLRKRHLMVGKVSALAWKKSPKIQDVELQESKIVEKNNMK